MDIAEILKKAKAPERTVDLCLDADLAAEHDELSRQLAEAQRASVTIGAKMADTGHAAEVARKIRDLEERMAGAVVTFRVRALSAYKFQEWLAAHPAREGKEERFNPATGLAPLLAACSVDPAMSEDEARQLVEVLGSGQTDRLFAACWEATNGDSSVPFSVAASVSLRGSEQKPK